MNKIEFDFNKKNEIPYVKINRKPTAYEKIDDSFKDFIDKGAWFVFEKVAEEITERKNYERAMEFTKGIGNFLRENGVTPIISEIGNATDVTHVVHFEGLDFSEHDKHLGDIIHELDEKCCRYIAKYNDLERERNYLASRFEELKSENEILKQRIAELEGKGTERVVEIKTYATPIEIATHLINNTCTINELKMIAEHINVYCNGGK